MARDGNKNERLKELPKFCEWCGIKQSLSKHRIKPGREQGKYILSNIVSACLNCHNKMDREIISREKQLKIVERRNQLFRNKFRRLFNRIKIYAIIN